MEYLALIAENELLRIENEQLKRCPFTTIKGVHGVSGMLRK